MLGRGRATQPATYKTFADDDLSGMLRENPAAERIVISTYQEMIRWLADGDASTRRMLERFWPKRKSTPTT